MMKSGPGRSQDFYVGRSDNHPAKYFSSKEVVQIVFRNTGTKTLKCRIGTQPELGPHESIRLERLAGNEWVSAQRPFERVEGIESQIKPGQVVIRLWPAFWSDAGQYRAIFDCGGISLVTYFETIYFDLGVSGK
jgi:hypothetical protein